MPSYVITGASRGIGLEFVKQISARPNTQVFGLVRNRASASALESFASSSPNVHILQADILDHALLKNAAAEVSDITGGTLDVLINNAAYVAGHKTTSKLTDFEGKEDELEKELRGSFDTNVIGVIHTTNAFLPLLRAGVTKKVITLTSSVADKAFIEQTGLVELVPYTISKVAVNMVITKYAVQFKDEGFLFLALSPGLVNTAVRHPTPEELENSLAIFAKFAKLKPSLTPMTPPESVELQLKIIDNATPKDSGAFISHHGNQEWL